MRLFFKESWRYSVALQINLAVTFNDVLQIIPARHAWATEHRNDKRLLPFINNADKTRFGGIRITGLAVYPLFPFLGKSLVMTFQKNFPSADRLDGHGAD